MPYSVKGFFEINEDMVQILLMLEVLFTQNSKVEDLFCGASSGSEPSLFFSNYFFSLGFQPVQMGGILGGGGGGGGGGKGYVGPPSQIIGGGLAPPGPPSSYAYELHAYRM